MRAVRFGSYSMWATFAGTPSLSLRRKSMTRYARLWPPPMWRVVMRPALFRPPDFGSGRTSDFSGVSRVISTKSATLEPRRPGVVGLYLRIPMRCQSLACRRSADRSPEDVDRALAQRDDRALGVLATADAEPRPPRLALAADRVDGLDLHAEDLLDRDLDLGLVRARVHLERVLALVEEAVALLRDDGADEHVPRVLVQRGHLLSSASRADASPDVATAFALRPVGRVRNASSAPRVKTTSSDTRTS